MRELATSPWRMLCTISQVVFSKSIVALPCGRSEFYIPGDIACHTCVTGAVCNGTASLTTEPNYWRAHDATYTFFKCGDMQPCVGGTTVGTCSPGFRGPLCALCKEGYAGETCVECGDSMLSLCILGLFGLAYFVVVGVVVLKAVGKGHDDNVSRPMIVFKVALTYFQVWEFDCFAMARPPPQPPFVHDGPNPCERCNTL